MGDSASYSYMLLKMLTWPLYSENLITLTMTTTLTELRKKLHGARKNRAFDHTSTYYRVLLPSSDAESTISLSCGIFFENSSFDDDESEGRAGGRSLLLT